MRFKFLILLLFSLIWFSGCLSSNRQSKALTSLEVWFDADTATLEILKSLTAEFEYKNQKYKTIFRRIGFDDLKATILGSKESSDMAPDLVMFSSDWLGELVENKIVLKTSLDKEIEKDFLEQAKAAMKYKSDFYGVPWSLDCIALIYNKKLVASAPADLDDLLAVKDKLPHDVYTLLYDNKNLYFHVPWVHSFSGAIIENNRVLSSYQKVADSFDFAWQLEQVYKVVPPKSNQPAAINLFCSGKAAMTINGPWIIKDVIRNGIDFKVAPIPAIQGVSRPYIGIKGFAVTTFCKNPAAAEKLVNIMTSRSTIEKLARASLLVPCYKSLIDNENIPGWIKGFIEQARSGILIPSDPAMKHCWSELNRALRLRFTSEVDSETLILQARERIENAITREHIKQ